MTPKWQLVLLTPDEHGEMVARGHVAGLSDFKAFDVTPDHRALVLSRYWGPTMEQFAAMLRESGDLEAQP